MTNETVKNKDYEQTVALVAKTLLDKTDQNCGMKGR